MRHRPLAVLWTKYCLKLLADFPPFPKMHCGFTASGSWRASAMVRVDGLLPNNIEIKGRLKVAFSFLRLLVLI